MMKRFLAFMLAFCLCLALCACKNSPAKAVENLISSIGEVTLESAEKINEVLVQYNALTEEQKQEVANYETLKSAKDALDRLQRIATVEDLIDPIGYVTINSMPSIQSAQDAFNALPVDEQNEVSNKEVLDKALSAYQETVINQYWSVKYYIDEFGEKTKDSYVVASFDGTFTKERRGLFDKNDLTVVVFYDPGYPDKFEFRLLEYGSHKASLSINDIINLSFKVNGKVYEIECETYAYDGEVYLPLKLRKANKYLEEQNGDRKTAFNALKNALLQNEGPISCNLYFADNEFDVLCLGFRDTYSFQIETVGFAENVDKSSKS